MSVQKRNTFAGFKAKCTFPVGRDFPSSASMMERMVTFWDFSWVETMLTSRPMTSRRTRSQERGPSSFKMKSSGRMPTCTGWSATPGVDRTASEPMYNCSFFTSPENTLMGGVPRNFATNRFTGSSYTFWGLPICCTIPSFITTIISEMLMASS